MAPPSRRASARDGSWCAASASLIACLGLGCSPAPSPVDAATDASYVDTERPVDAESPTPFCVPGATVAYPPAPYRIGTGATLPDLSFPSDRGEAISLRSFFAPCEPHPALLVVRVFAAWSGPSRWHAAHTARARSFAPAGRLRVLDLLAFGQENLPAEAAELGAWRARYDAPPDALAVDPGHRFREVFLTTGHLPIVMYVDPRTMRALFVRMAPKQDELQYDLARFEAQLAGRAPPVAAAAPVLIDDRFSVDRWEQIQAMSPVPAPPPSPTNRFADDPNAAALGRALFFDPRLSPSGTVSCATCHAPEQNFADGMPTARGVGVADRNAPSIVFASHLRWQFWDGRADTLWSQALGPFENAAEMASSRLLVAHRVAAAYAEPFSRVFGALPALQDAARFPPSGAPGDPAWERMAPEDRASVDRLFVQVGKAIEAYERTLRSRPTRFDAYVAGDRRALTETERDGLREFMSFGCIQCHHGPTLTDQSFHNVQMRTGRTDGSPDRGRIDAIDQLLRSPFRADGAFSDAPAAAPGALSSLRASPSMLGAFRTPTLRGVATTGPWGHGGTLLTLRELVRHYADRTSTEPVDGSAGVPDPHLNGFYTDDTTLRVLAAFLGTLDDRAIVP